MLDLGVCVNILSYLVPVKLRLKELHPTPIVLTHKLIYNNTSRYCGGCAIQINKFYFPIDFIVIDTQLVQNSNKHISMILGPPILATADARIQCRIGNIQLSFGNMIVELNIFNITKQPLDKDDVKVDLIKELVNYTFPSNLNNDPLQKCLIHFSLKFDINKSIDEVNALFDSSPSMDTN